MLHIIYSSQWVLVNIQLISGSSLLHCTVYCQFVDSAPFTNCARVWVSLIVVVNVVYASYYMFQHIVALCCFTSVSLQIMNGSDLLLLLIFCYLLRSSPPLPVLSSPHTYEWHLHTLCTPTRGAHCVLATHTMPKCPMFEVDCETVDIVKAYNGTILLEVQADDELEFPRRQIRTENLETEKWASTEQQEQHIPARRRRSWRRWRWRWLTFYVNRLVHSYSSVVPDSDDECTRSIAYWSKCTVSMERISSILFIVDIQAAVNMWHVPSNTKTKQSYQSTERERERENYFDRTQEETPTEKKKEKRWSTIPTSQRVFTWIIFRMNSK